MTDIMRNKLSNNIYNLIINFIIHCPNLSKVHAEKSHCFSEPCILMLRTATIFSMDMKTRLIELVRKQSFLKSDEPIFKLASGEMSKVYFDLRLTTLSPEGQHLIGNLVFEKLEDEELRPKAAGGLTMGADPVASALAHVSHLKGVPIEALVIRKEPKEHGRGRQIEGNVSEGDDIVIIDDVLTTGGSTIKAVNIARSYGLNVLAAIIILDRCEKNGRANVEEHCPVYSILEITDFK
jgi:orotate phosphoribosyltransferase